jgi:hypothetical protein
LLYASIMDDDVYRELLSSNLTSGIQLTGANLHQFETVARMGAVVAKQDGLQEEGQVWCIGCIDGSMSRADVERQPLNS